MERRLCLSAYSFATTGTFAPFPKGATPESNVIIDANGDAFGTTYAGGTYGKGTVYEIAAGTQTVTSLLSFSGTNGSEPRGKLAEDAAGNIFGTTLNGGLNSTGTIFEISPSLGTVTTLTSFPSGIAPSGSGLTIDGAGNLYGVSYNSVYRYSPGGSVTALIPITSGSQTPEAIVSDPAGNLFIVLNSPYNGEALAQIVELPAGANSIFVLHSSSQFGQMYGGLVLDSSDDVFGLASIYGSTTVFEIALPSGNFSTLTTLPSATIGTDTDSLAIDSHGDLIGTGQRTDGTNLLSVFELPAGQTNATVLTTVNAADGYSTDGSIWLDSAGNVFGTALNGSNGAQGVVFELPVGSSSDIVLGRFNTADGGTPVGVGTAITEDGSGNLYGVTRGGGVYGQGTIYEIAKQSGVITTLASLQDVAGEVGANCLVFDSSGDLFGTSPGTDTTLNGSFDSGGIFELAAGTSIVKLITSFPLGGGYSADGIPVFDAAGNMFFTTADGGAGEDGDILELPKGASSVTQLATFDGTDGVEPTGGLLIDSAGDLFGTCSGGGPNGDGGLIFELPIGASTPVDLYTFTVGSTNGSDPYAGLTAAANGLLYGTTENGGADDEGTLFSFNPKTKSLATITNFDGSVLGSQSDAPLVADAFGNLFGDSIYGGTNNAGVAFEIAGGKTVTPIASLPIDGTTSGLILDPSGVLFGTQTTGGTAGAGVVYSLTPSDHIAFTQGSTTATVGTKLASVLTIAVQDNSGSTANIATGVALSVVSGPVGGTISGAATENTSNGIASFANLTFSVAGTYVLSASGGGVLTGTSAPFTVTAVVATGVVSGSVTNGPTGETIYLDANNNSALDSTEPSTTLLADGTYSFTGVAAGAYVVRQVLPNGFTQTSPAGGYGIHVTVTNGGSLTGENFADTAPVVVTTGSVAGTVTGGVAGEVVYLDANNDGVFDSGDLSTTTSSAGAFSFASIPAGSYVLRQVLPTGYSQTTPAGNAGIAITVAAGSALTGENFVDAAPVAAGGSISGTVFDDANGNAAFDSTEAGIAGITVYNDANNNSILDPGETSTVTTSGGAYTFANLVAGNYKIRAILPSGYKQTTPANNYGFTIALKANQVVAGDNFGQEAVVTAGSVAGTVTGGVAGEVVYLDANSDGTLDSGELSTATSSTGTFSFAGVPVGSYVLRQVLPTGYTQTTPSGNAGIALAVAAGSALANENFVDAAPAAAGGSVSGTVANGLTGETIYLDANNNSVLDPTELSTTTSATGFFSFSNVPVGAYVVRQVLPSGYTQTSPASNYGIHVSVTNGGSLSGNNFTDKAPVVATTGSVSGTVTGGPAGEVIYLDANGNGVLDSNELSTTTASTGAFSFAGVPAGSYVLRQVLAGGYTQASPASNAGIAVAVTAGGSLTNENFIDTAPASTGGSVSGTVTGGAVGETVYLDANNNSVLDGTELSTTTSATGTFNFTNVPAGAYIVRQVLPSGYTQTSPSGGLGIHLTVTAASSFAGENFTDKAPAVVHTKLTGTTIGTAGSYNNSGNTIAKATDGSLSTYFDAQASNGNWVGYDLGTATSISQIAYAPRSGYGSRMVGGQIQISTSADFSTGVTTIYTIGSAPPNSLTTITLSSPVTAQYIRYLSPDGSHGDISEFEVFS